MKDVLIGLAILAVSAGATVYVWGIVDWLRGSARAHEHRVSEKWRRPR